MKKTAEQKLRIIKNLSLRICKEAHKGLKRNCKSPEKFYQSLGEFHAADFILGSIVELEKVDSLMVKFAK